MRKSQITVEYLLLIGIIVLIILVIVAYTWQPRAEIQLSRAAASLGTISDNANAASQTGVGNTFRFQVEIMPNIHGISYQNGNMVLEMGEEEDLYGFHRRVHTNVTGFFDNRLLGVNLTEGTYDLIAESFESGVCIYQPGMREEQCRCFSNVDERVSFLQIQDNGNSHQVLICDDESCYAAESEELEERSFSYGETVHQIKTDCRTTTDGISELYPQPRSVHYTITNWKDEVVHEWYVFERDEDNYFTLNEPYVIQNSGPLSITATCLHECFYVAPNPENLHETVTTVLHIPEGELVPFFIDPRGNRVVANRTILPVLGVDSGGDFMDRGFVRAGERFVLRTGYECMGGECINVQPSLYYYGVFRADS